MEKEAALSCALTSAAERETLGAELQERECVCVCLKETLG
jgi:hypothetical protein